jgi:hypothetical protein
MVKFTTTGSQMSRVPALPSGEGACFQQSHISHKGAHLYGFFISNMVE